jgi:putative flavoprotein involved in K+ transport
MGEIERHETVIIGGGQAGLATGYHLARLGRPFVILDGGARVGDAWRTRWGSLRLFSPARYDGLPGWRFPAPGWSFPTKDEMADYLEAYAQRFALPVLTEVRVDGLAKDGNRFVVTAGERRFAADAVVVATGAHRTPRTPALAAELDPRIHQLHSAAYRDPADLPDGPALVVGAGNSGAEIALELSRTRPVWLAGRDVGEIPVRHGSRRSRLFIPVIRFLGHRVLTVRTPVGRRVGPGLAHGATPLIRTRTEELVAAGVERVPRVADTRDGLPVLEDWRPLEPAVVVWCTGFRQDLSWIDLPVLGDDGRPAHVRGVALAEPGLAFVGLPFQYAVTSDVLPGVGRDARRVARHVARRGRAAGRPAPDGGGRPDAAITVAAGRAAD